MSRIGLFCFLVVAIATPVSHAQVLGKIAPDGHIVLLGHTDLIGLDFQSAGEYLVPVSDPDPFLILLANTSGEIAYGSLLDSAVTLDGELTLSARYTPPDDVVLTDDLLGLWGGPGDDGEILFVPEATGGQLILIGLAICLGFRRLRWSAWS